MKKVYLYIIIGLMFINIVNAQLLDNIVTYHKADDVTTYPDAHASYDGTKGGTPTSQAGKINNAWDYDGINEYWDIGTVTEMSGIQTMSISLWVRRQASKDYAGFYSMYTDSNNRLGLVSGTSTLYGGQDDLLIVAYDAGVGLANTNNDVLPLNTWTHVVLLFDGTATGDSNRLKVYINNNLETLTFTSAIPSQLDGGTIRHGFDEGGVGMACRVDEVGLWDRVLTPTEVSDLYNSGSGLSYDSFTSTAVGTPTIVINSNIDNTTSKGLIEFPDGIFIPNINGTITNNSDIYNVKIYINGTLNITYSNLNLSNNNQLNWSFENFEGAINFTIHATNENATGKTINYLYFDGINPEISQTGVINETKYYHNITTEFYSDITASDTNLFAINYTLKNETGAIISTIFNDSLSTNPQYDNFLINITSLDVGKYYYNLRAWDSHTAKEISQYKIKETIFDNKKAYEIEDNIYIFGEDINKIDFFKEIDRYTFDIDFKKKNPIIEIYAEDLKYIENSIYPAHFVSIKYNKWIDFVNDGINLDYNIIELDPGHYSIQLLTDETKIKFKSIGDLNVFETEYNFNVTTPMNIKAINSITSETINSFTINVDGHDYITTTGTAHINITSGSYVTNISAEGYVDNSTTVVYSEGGEFQFGLTASRSLNLFFYDEQTDILINAKNISIDVINFDNESFSYTTITGSKFISGFVPGNYEIRFNADGYNPRTYYTVITNASTQVIRLYLLNTSVASYITFSIEDETGNYLENATVSATRFYTSVNAYRVVEMDKANFQGEAVFSLEKYDTRYNFIVVYNGVTVYSSSAGYKLTENSYQLPVNLLGDTTQSYFGINQDVSTQLSYNNATKLITFTVSDSSNLVEHFCVKVDQMQSLSDAGYYEICNNCLTATSGSVVCNISDYYTNGREIVARGFVETNTTYSSYWTDVLSVITDTTGKAVLGTVGVFLAFLISFTVAMIGFSVGGLQLAILGLDIGIVVSKIVGLMSLGLAGLFGIIGVSFIIIFLIGERP